MKQFLRRFGPFIMVFIFALVLRFYGLDNSPSSLYYDELDLGYQTRSLIETGKDYRGTFNPFYLRSFNTDKAPIPILLSIPSSLFFDSPYLQVRGSFALAGTLVVVLGSLIIWFWTKSKLASFLGGLVLVANPWYFQFSRIAFEAIYVPLFYLGFLTLFYLWLQKKKLLFFYASIILLGLEVYIYRPMSLYAPLTLFLLFIIYFREIKKTRVKNLVFAVVLFLIIVLPFIYKTTLKSADTPRFNQISVFSDKEIPIWVQREREVDSGDLENPEVGRKPVFYSYFFHNKVISWLSKFKDNYLSAFSFDFLFLEGDENVRHAPSKTAEFLLMDLVGLLIGTVYLFNNLRNINYRWLMVLLVTSPIPSALTQDGGTHASRLILLGLSLAIIIALGWWQIFVWLRKNLKNKFIRVAFYSIIFVFWITNLVFFLHRYFVHYSLESATWFGYGYKEIAEEFQKSDYKELKITESLDPPILYYLYWAKIPPSEVQSYGSQFGEDVVKGGRLDNIKQLDWKSLTKDLNGVNLKDVLEDETLYAITRGDIQLDFRNEKDMVPAGIKLIKVIKYPDNEVAFYLIAKV